MRCVSIQQLLWSKKIERTHAQIIDIRILTHASHKGVTSRRRSLLAKNEAGEVLCVKSSMDGAPTHRSLFLPRANALQVFLQSTADRRRHILSRPPFFPSLRLSTVWPIQAHNPEERGAGSSPPSAELFLFGNAPQQAASRLIEKSNCTTNHKLKKRGGTLYMCGVTRNEKG